jgi:NAD-dependent deacetylase
MVYASIEAFREDPAKYWTIRGEFIRNTVLFGEQLPKAALETAYHQSATCKLMRVIGTSAVVQPAASLPALARQEGAKIVEVNIERAFPGADFVVEQKAGVGLSVILEEIKKIAG